MTIRRLIQNLAFDQDDIERLAAAYEEALRALHISDRDDPINKVIAQRIIEGARAGVRDHGRQGPYGPITSTSNSSGASGRRNADTPSIRFVYSRVFASKKHSKHRPMQLHFCNSRFEYQGVAPKRANF